jgi:hypothetical protein
MSSKTTTAKSSAKVGADDYVRINVAGDGNCFYRSLYNGLKYHTQPGLLTKFFNCLFAGSNGPADPETLTENQFWQIVRIKLADEIADGARLTENVQHIFTQLQTGAQEYIAFLGSPEYAATQTKLAADKAGLPAKKKKNTKQIQTQKEAVAEFKAIMKDAKKLLIKEETDELIALLKDTSTDLEKANNEISKLTAASAKLTPEVLDAEFQHYVEVQAASWALVIDAMPYQIQEDDLLGKPESYAEMTLETFREELSSFVRSASIYASEFDIKLLFTLLEPPNCAHSITFENVEPGRPIRELKDGIPVVHLHLSGEHYNFVVRGDVYNTTALKRRKITAQYQQGSAKKPVNKTKKNNSNSPGAKAAIKAVAAAAAAAGAAAGAGGKDYESNSSLSSGTKEALASFATGNAN